MYVGFCMTMVRKYEKNGNGSVNGVIGIECDRGSEVEIGIEIGRERAENGVL